MNEYQFSTILPKVYFTHRDYFAYYIANNCRADVISTLIIETLLSLSHDSNSSIGSKAKVILLRRVGSQKLTLLHILAIKGHNVALKLLASINFVSTNIPDKRGFTPLHHAALNKNFASMEILLNAGANPNLRNFRNGTPIDMLRLQGHFLAPPDREGFVFSHTTIYPRSLLIADWHKPFTSTTFSEANRVRTLYDRFEKRCHRSPRFKIITLTKDDAGNPLPPEVGKGVICTKKVKPGSVCFTFGGIVSDSQSHNSSNNEYLGAILSFDRRTFVVNARKIGGIGSRVSDGPPNVMIFPLSNANGAPEISVAVATTKIEPGDIITMDYHGEHRVKDHHFEVSPQRLRSWMRNYDHETFTSNLPHIYAARATAPISSISASADIKIVIYILNTPTSLIDLIASNLMPLNTLKQLTQRFKHNIAKTSFAVLKKIILADTLISLDYPGNHQRIHFFKQLQKAIELKRTRQDILSTITETLLRFEQLPESEVTSVT
ncbi:MAG: ankyrin repeat domain-containing protein [Rhabdochlamydiaceae bacterium]|nr:ankyrin repeat domain-containing protein [Candidatus Amphrikana amoebophyrae]